jgi:hypothetical protein
MSASGQYQTAVTYGASVYISQNYGSSWIAPSSPPPSTLYNYNSVSISASGQYQLTSSSNGYCYYSTTYGNSWTLISSLPSVVWISTAISASAQYQVVCTSVHIYLSSNYGSSWNMLSFTPSGSISSVSISASGQYISTVGGNIYISSNYGASFTTITTVSDTFISICMSASGQYQMAISNTAVGGGAGIVYTSINYGNTWNASSLTTGYQWTGLSISYTGQYQVVATIAPTLYLSTDYGNSWTVPQFWFSTGNTYLAISASGQYLSVATSGVNIYSSNIYISSAKSFIIDHPLDYSKYLVHACLEGPEAGVYYRGRSEVTNDVCVEITLPNYVCDFARDFTIKVTSIHDGTPPKIYSPGEIINNRFTVYGRNGSFYWTVTGRRGNIIVEPNKSDIIVKGDGPYRWYGMNNK